ncbi:hypothetical protein SISNIDRAFT_489376 [Sistotremastrum niveocremeum HHB9708]|uniref:Uncharacterized protein n=1 Tax=Sistotremastrum niveocremeum HHB9708 TaxID=1314777 RepID=A0A164Q8B7_9AGAM|nr:hypothetical protein SISNIDRAFT_489376 [Sistotremastrum niveocremeum HHB9708]
MGDGSRRVDRSTEDARIKARRIQKDLIEINKGSQLRDSMNFGIVLSILCLRSQAGVNPPALPGFRSVTPLCRIRQFQLSLLDLPYRQTTILRAAMSITKSILPVSRDSTQNRVPSHVLRLHHLSDSRASFKALLKMHVDNVGIQLKSELRTRSAENPVSVLWHEVQNPTSLLKQAQVQVLRSPPRRDVAFFREPARWETLREALAHTLFLKLESQKRREANKVVRRQTSTQDLMIPLAHSLQVIEEVDE